MDMQSGSCVNCGAAYGPDDVVCSYCGSPIKREPEGYGGLNQQTYQSSNGGTQVIQNIYVTNNGSGSNYVNGSLDRAINSAVNKVSQAASNDGSGDRVARNRIIAGILAIVFGWIGGQFFYLNKIALGIVCVIFCYTGIPALVGIIHGILILKMSDAEFREKYHV